MIVKLVYQDLIHRVTDIPSELSDLRAIIMSSFKTTLPESFSLSYTIAGEVENATLATTEDYQALLAMEPESKTVKIIVGERKASGDYDIIAQTKEANYEEERKFEGDASNRGLAEFVENVSESVIIPQVQKYPYISGAQEQDDDKTKKIVREVLKEQLPFIISQVKDAVLKELRPLMPIYQQVNQPPKVQQQQQRPQERRFEEDKIEINPVPSEVIFERSHEVYGNEEQERQQNVQAGDKTDILDKMKKFGTALKDQLVVLPGKAKVAFDEVAQKLEGDPYITCEEGKYPKSVVEKANLLREIFPEEEKKVLLEFVKQYPRHANLEQLANLYLVKDEPQQAAAPEGQNNNA